jgi:dTDP-4-amino-4,6-dideoxygalactose transaminase
MTTPKLMRQIPFIKPDLPPFESVERQFREILENGKITNFGKYVTQFEQDAAAHLGVEAVTLSSGTQAMVMALQALGIQKGQKVILPSFTFMATGQSILYAGGVPVFAEITDDLTLCPKDLAALLEKHDDVFAVIPVHMYGLPARVDEIEAVVRDASQKRGRHINVVYDAAHAFGSESHGRKVGTFGDAEVFSLSVTKVVVTVEGGLVTSRNPELIERIRKMRNYGIESNYHTFYPGMNGKMSEFHAIVGVENLKRLDELMRERQIRARAYFDRVTSATGFIPCAWPDCVMHTFKDFSVMTPEKLEGKRDDVIAFLKERGVETRAYFYPPLHEQNFFQPYVDRRLPATETLSRRVITLPFFSSITDGEMDYVVQALAAAERSL